MTTQDETPQQCVDPANIRIEDYDYPLPEERIATHPLAQRDSCKLLVSYPDGRFADYLFSDIVSLLPGNSLLVANDTRVINARLRFRKSTGALIEVFVLEPVEPVDYACSFASTSGCSWTCFVGNSKRWKSGELSLPVEIEGVGTVILTAKKVDGVAEGDSAARVIDFGWDNSDISFSQIIAAAGEIPIPPYLNRNSEESDTRDYQTVFSRVEGSVAAPTAGLHFTPELLSRLAEKGIERRTLTLHVGAGTFKPVKSDTIADHDMHSEFISVSRGLIAELAKRKYIVTAVGTTSVRTLESLYHLGCMAASGMEIDRVEQWYPYSPSHPDLSVEESFEALLRHLDSTGADYLTASTRIIIVPGYKYRVVDNIITNFHQPRSTLLLLVSAFIGERWKELYRHALDCGYRFLSYGDACLLLGRRSE